MCNHLASRVGFVGVLAGKYATTNTIVSREIQICCRSRRNEQIILVHCKNVCGLRNSQSFDSN